MEIENRAQVTGKHRYQGPHLLHLLPRDRVVEDPGNKVAMQRLQQINHLVSRPHLT